MTLWQDLPKTKALTALGLIISSTLGCVFAVILANLFLNAITAGFFLSFVVQLGAVCIGALNGTIAFLQGLKYAQKWPLENNGPFVFSISTFISDIKISLRKIDWEILRYVSLVAVDYIDPSLRENLRHRQVSPNDPFLSRMGQHVTNWLRILARTGSEEYLLPNGVRFLIAQQMHMLNYERVLSHVPDVPEAQRNVLKQQEIQNYCLSAFATELNSSEKGFFETIGSTLYNEYEHPPVIIPSPRPA